jgi:hypothetical protein
VVLFTVGRVVRLEATGCAGWAIPTGGCKVSEQHEERLAPVDAINFAGFRAWMKAQAAGTPDRPVTSLKARGD